MKQSYRTAWFIAVVLLGAFTLFWYDVYERSGMKTVPLVEVPASQKPLFPDSCIVCNRIRNEKLELLAMSDEHSRVEFYLYGIDKKPAQGVVLHVPIHDTCARGERTAFWKRLLLILGIAVVIVACGFALHASAVVTVSLAAIIAAFLLYGEFRKPTPFEFWQYGGKYFLLFQDRAYAEQFARLNKTAVQECTNAYTGRPFSTRTIRKGNENK